MIDERFELLCQKHLDAEATAAERAELTERISIDPEARRHFEEFVALEGLLFAVGNTDRPGDGALSTTPFSTGSGAELAELGREPLPEEEELITSGAWLPSAVGALVLAVIVWWGVPDPGSIVSTPAVPEPVPLELAMLSDGYFAVPQETDDPSIQFIWIGATTPAEGNEE